jgi:hypothetical protein
MADEDLRDQISSLEAHIAELTGVIQSCRKLILVSKIAIVAGGIWLLAFMFGATRFDSMAMAGAIAAVIGGTLVFGSNTSTSKQAVADVKAAEATSTHQPSASPTNRRCIFPISSALSSRRGW